METCPFCDFKDKGVIIHEDELCIAVVSRNPINKYHSMVIPKVHHENFVDMPDELASHIFLVAKKVSTAVRRVCNPDAIHHMSDDDVKDKGFNLIRHYKFHIIPRFTDDGIIIEWKRAELTLEEREEIANEIRGLL